MRRAWLWIAIPIVIVLAIVLWPKPSSGKVVRVNSSNLELQAAAKEAQRSLPGFIEELEQAPPEARFAVKGAFPTGSGPEYMWVRDPTYTGGIFSGILDQDPMLYKRAKRGDKVAIKKEDVFDWFISKNGTVRGRFTEEVLSR